MHRRNDLHVVTRWLRSDVTLLFFFWLAGLVIGTLVLVPDPPLMRPQPQAGVSIVSAIVTTILPFLLAALAVHINRKKLIWFICFLKAFSFAFCGALIWSSYAGAGWLVRFLLMFTDICTLPVFCWYCIRSFSTAKRGDLAVCILISLTSAGIDHFVVSPFLAKLITI